ncbi:tetrahydromethanopterin S-methyltransferase subunit H [bacterium BMS3Abin08]|nr:tetrahydromethanopterin S-methyltransferase subunit H [bacterium BMS3Abin08]
MRSVCGINMGGDLGDTPALLAGSIFYDRQKIVSDPLTGQFDKNEAKRLINLQSKWSEITGIPCCIDVIASTPKAMKTYLDFIVENFEGPIMVDGTSSVVKIEGIRHMAANDLSNRVIYNSISQESTREEFETIGECGVKAVVVLLVESSDFSAEGKIRMMTKEDGLIAKLGAEGVTEFLVDPGIIDLPSMGVAMEVMSKAKEMGYLPGTAAHNAISTWSGLKAKIGDNFKKPAIAVINALTVAWGGEFVIYGPMVLADTVFPAVAMVEAALAQSAMERGKCPDLSHPLFKIA